MSYHYKKDGSLDMRYSSSKSYVSSGGSSCGPSRSSYSSYRSPAPAPAPRYYAPAPSPAPRYYAPTPSPAPAPALRYKKNGTLDMRFSSSKAAVRSGDSRSGPSRSFGGSSSSRSPAPSSTPKLHYKKNGTLDMRYRSSKSYVSSVGSRKGGGSSSYSSSDSATGSSQKAAVPFPSPKFPSHLHLTKAGVPDMRYKSSREFMAESTGTGGQQTTLCPGLPSNCLTKKGLPNMTTGVGQAYVKKKALEAAAHGDLPAFVPLNKKGNPDTQTAVGRAFLKGVGCDPKTIRTRKCNHHAKLKANDVFMDFYGRFAAAEQSRLEPIFIVTECASQVESGEQGEDVTPPLPPTQKWQDSISETVENIDHASLVISSDELGRGAFGVVHKATHDGKEVAVKTLHLSKLTKKDKRSFVSEINALHKLGGHPNIIGLFGYSLKPPAIIMELVPLGNLNHMLHYEEEPKFEAMMMSGVYKKKIIFGIANGMQQIVMAGMLHGDLKPQNVLLGKDFVPKLCDFGLVQLRGKCTATTASSTMEADDDSGGAGAPGTPAYMAPELLDAATKASEKTDVYSFGIIMNEIIAEEEPFTNEYGNFLGKGVYAAALYAKQGNRPEMNTEVKNLPVGHFIQECWHAVQRNRPSFATIVSKVACMTIPSQLN